QPDEDVGDVRAGDPAEHRPQRGADRDPERPIDARGDEDGGRELEYGHPRGPGNERHHYARARNETTENDREEAETMDPFGPAIDLRGIDVDPRREPVGHGRTEAPGEEVGH